MEGQASPTGKPARPVHLTSLFQKERSLYLDILKRQNTLLRHAPEADDVTEAVGTAHQVLRDVLYALEACAEKAAQASKKAKEKDGGNSPAQAAQPGGKGKR